MEFQLNSYHRNVNDNDLIEDVIRTAKKLNKKTLTTDEYSKHGSYHHSTLIRRFGSWQNVLQLCSLKTDGHNFKCSFTDEDVIKDIIDVAKKLNKETITKEEYNGSGKFSGSTLSKKYGGWSAVLKLAGLKLNCNRNISNEDMFKEIERIWILLGHQPTTTDIKNGISTISLQSFVRRFGGWRNTLVAFMEYMNLEITEKNTNELHDEEIKDVQIIKHKTKRDINLRLRFKVMQRDNFKCCICGSSPAKDPAIELHIDHIIPWSKGGETVIDNLQTLCTNCNLGKSDLV